MIMRDTMVRDCKISYENKKMREWIFLKRIFSLNFHKSIHKALGKNFLDDFNEFLSHKLPFKFSIKDISF